MIEPALLFGDRYELGPVIGRGGMAEVRSGRDTRLDRPVAVKILRPEMAYQPGVRDRFESEARLAARLVHPHVVAVFDSGETDGVPFIVMERLPGQTLFDRMAQGPMPADEVRAVAVSVLAALQAAHEAGIIHRDIKPGNVLATGTGGWKVGDFGIAKALEMGSSELTSTGVLLGTPAYLAPERFFGSAATVASDLYSLGVVLYEALAGRKPFQTDRPEAWASLVSGTAPAPLGELRPDVDPALAAVVERCLAKDPADRFWSAAEMAAVLRGRASRPAEAAPEEAPAPPGAAPTEVLPLAQRLRRHDGLVARVVAAGVAVVAVVVILAVTFSGSGGGGSGVGSGASAGPGASAGRAPAATVPAVGANLPAGLSHALKNLERQVSRR